MDDAGNSLEDHLDKATSFWHCFKGTNDQVDHKIFLPTVPGLDHLADVFSEEEIEGIVRHLKPDKAPAPDGFTGLFIKKMLTCHSELL